MPALVIDAKLDPAPIGEIDFRGAGEIISLVIAALRRANPLAGKISGFGQFSARIERWRVLYFGIVEMAVFSPPFFKRRVFLFAQESHVHKSPHSPSSRPRQPRWKLNLLNCRVIRDRESGRSRSRRTPKKGPATDPPKVVIANRCLAGVCALREASASGAPNKVKGDMCRIKCLPNSSMPRRCSSPRMLRGPEHEWV